MKMIDEEYYRVKVTLKRDITNNEPIGAYSYEATSIEVLKEDIKENRAMAGHTEAAVTASRFSNSSISAAKLLKDVEKSHLPGIKLLDKSQILTNNGHDSTRRRKVLREAEHGLEVDELVSKNMWANIDPRNCPPSRWPMPVPKNVPMSLRPITLSLMTTVQR